MAISRMQNPRQLYGLGSFVKSITKPVKKVVSGAVDTVKDVAGSDLGKAALTAAALYYAGGGNLFGLQRSGLPMGPGFQLRNLPGAAFFTGGNISPNLVDEVALTGKQNLFQRAFSKIPGGGATAGILGASAVAGLLTPEAEADVEQLKESGDRGLVRKYLDRYYRNLNPIGDKEPEAYEAEVASFVRTNEAEGGRIGYARGTDELPNDPTEPVNPFKPKPIKPLGSDKMASKEGFTMEDSFKEEDRKVKEALEAYKRYRASGGKKSFRDFIRMIGTGNFAEGGRIGFASGTEESEVFKAYRKAIADGTFTGSFDAFLEYIDMMNDRLDSAQGGRIGFAYGPDSSQMNAVKAAGIEGLPLNKNPAGITELDLRETGGFIPPVGVQEKADDIPAMLSNNEFVFTADAVRGMGGGDVNKGAQRLYDQMKMLEEGGRV